MFANPFSSKAGIYLATDVRSVVALVVSLPELVLAGPLAIAAGAICLVIWIVIARDMRRRSPSDTDDRSGREG